MAQISKSMTPSTNLSNESSVVSHPHGNLWGDDLIQSLSSPYGAPAYRERAERLIEELKHLLSNYMEDSCNDDLIKRLEMVDTLECLGIDRHFQPEIRVALDYVYRCWNERGIGMGSRDSLIKNLNATALGFRSLRLHQYNVSSDVLENFKDENGQFFCNSIGEDEEGDKRVRSMLSLFRAADISFPGEKVLGEAKAFTTYYLSQVLGGRDVIDINQSLLEKMKYALEFPWHCSLPRLEARSFVEIYVQDESWLRSTMNKKILELAKLDFNIVQSTHQAEIQLISRWLKDSGIVQLNCYRKRHVELHFMVAIGTFEPEFSVSRLAFTKLGTVMTILDDLYDTHGTLDELNIFTEAVRRWDLSMIDRLPDYMKIALEIFLTTSNELITVVAKEQGRDMAAYIRKNAWERFVESDLIEAKWIATRHIPTFNEYIENATTSSGLCILNLIPHLLMGQHLPDNILEKLYSPSKIHHLVELTMRLADDIRDFKAEKEDGDLASVIECYLKDNPESTVEGALNHFNGVLDLSLKELNSEFMKHDSVPLCCKKYIFNFIRAVQLLTKYRDGFNASDKETKDQIFKVLIKPVPLSN